MDGKRLSPGQAGEIEITGLTSDGRGVGRMEGLAIFVPGLLPGEKALVRLDQVGKKYAQASLVNLLSPHLQRAEPACPYQGACGGCALQHAGYELQLELKRDQVAQALRRLGGVDLPMPLPLGAERVLRYRNRALVHALWQEGCWSLGFYREGSHELCPVDDCLLLRPALSRLLELTRQALTEMGPAWGDSLRGLALRCNKNEDQLLLTLIANQPLAAAEGWAAELTRQEERLIAVWENSGPPVYGQYGSEWKILAGEDGFSDLAAGLRLGLAPASFSQVHPEQAEKMYALVGEMAGLQGGETVLDLYCGAGAMGLSLADRAGRVVGVESYVPAAANAIANARANQIANYRCLPLDAAAAGEQLAAEGIHPQVAVVDPPRAGCSPRLIAALIKMAPPRLIYVSCDPATLARDVKLLSAAGYSLLRVQPVDMFCQTSHVETVCLLEKRKTN